MVHQTHLHLKKKEDLLPGKEEGEEEGGGEDGEVLDIQ
jgi:hypothetical protein